MSRVLPGGSTTGAATRAIRVLVVDDHPVVRAGMVAMLSEEPGLVVVGEAANGAHRNRGCSAGWRIGVEDFQDGSSYAAHPKDLDVAQRYLRRT